MQNLVWADLDEEARRRALARPQFRTAQSTARVAREIVDDIRARGAEALREHAVRLDGAEVSRIDVAAAAKAARAGLAAEDIAAMEAARDAIVAFHKDAIPPAREVETLPGVVCRAEWRPIGAVGCYVPAGEAPLFSTLMMLALPARAARVKRIVAVTPPRKSGGVDPATALAAELCGVDELYAVGGAQAIAGLAFGAAPLPRVDKICGPGNAYVAESKNYVSGLPGGPAIDMPAGPSELLVIADADADADMVAADLLSQAEHDRSAQVILVTTSAAMAEAVRAAVERQVATLPRADVARASLAEARVFIASGMDEALEISNAYAPEHLSLAVANAERVAKSVMNAGAVFAGGLAAETFGDYVAGPSHVLPTDGAARAWSGVSVLSFMRSMSVQTVTREGARRLAAPAARLARLEGLEAHARAAEIRLTALERMQ
jgi:histidinol dehydrogenase